MKIIFRLILSLFLCFLLYSNSYSQGWANSYKGTTEQDDNAYCIARDVSGNIYIGGSFENTVDADPGAGIANLINPTAAPNMAGFFGKYSSTGNYIWAKSIMSSGAGEATIVNGVSVDGSGNIYITGQFQGTVDFNPAAPVANLVSAGSNDIFIAKYDNNGNYLWASKIGGAASDKGLGICLDASNNIYITGIITGNVAIDFDPGVGTANVTAANQDGFIAKYDQNGNYGGWAFKIGGAGGNDNAYKIKVDASSTNVILCGSFANTTDFDPGAGTVNLSTPGNLDQDGYVAKYSTATGAYQWAFKIGGGTGAAGQNEEIFSVALDASDNVYVTGSMNYTTIDFDPSGSTINLSKIGTTDCFFARYTSAGAYVWAKNIGTAATSLTPNDLFVENTNVYVVGYFNNTVDFDPNVGIENMVSAGSNDIFFTQYSVADGSFVCKGRAGGASIDQARAVVGGGGTGYFYLSGWFRGTNIDFDPGSASVLLTSGIAGGFSDVFFAKYSLGTGGSGCTISIDPGISSNSPVCEGSALNLFSSTGDAHSWVGPNFFTSTDQNPTIASATPAATGTYTVTITVGASTASASITVVVNPKPTAYNVTGGGSYCNSGIGVAVGLDNSQSGVNYQLQLNSVNTGSPVAGTGSSISFGNQTAAGTFTIVATNSTTFCSNTMTGNVTVTINPLPTSYNITGGGAYCNGGSGVVVGLDNSQSGVYYQLQLNSVNTGSPVAGTGSAISFGNQTAAGTYTIVATNTTTFCSNTMTGNVLVSINSLPAVYNVTGGGSYCNGGSGVVVGLDNSQSGVNYQLELNSVNTGSPVAGTGSAISFGNQTAAGTFTIVATNTTTFCSNTMTGNVTVSINPLPTAYNVTGGGSYCIGGSGVLVGLDNSQSGVNYQLQLNSVNTGSPVAGTGSAISFGNQTIAGVYTILATNAITSCISTMTGNVIITINLNPVPDAGADVSICRGLSTQLNATGGINYSWSPGTALSDPSIENPMANPVIDVTYVVTVTDSNGCSATDNITVSINSNITVNAGTDVGICPGDSVTLNASGGVSYQWSPGTDLSSSIVSNPLASPSLTMTYAVTVTDVVGCSGIDEVIVTVYPVPVVNAGSDTAICFGEITNLNASGGATYLWDHSESLSDLNIQNPIASPTDTTIYTVTVTDLNGCINTDQVVVVVHPQLNVNAGNDTSFCAGSSVNLNVTNGISYLWSPAGGLSSPTIANPIANPGANTSYTVTVTDINGCSNTDDILVTVNPLPTVNAGGDISICLGNSTNLNASGGSYYTWIPNTGLSSSCIANPVANPTVSTTYNVIVIDENGCFNSDNVLITINANPVINAGLDQSICAGDSIILVATGGENYFWNTGDSTEQITVSPAINTSYIVTATNANGCSATDEISINIVELPVITLTSDPENGSFYQGQSITYTANPGNYSNYEFYAGNTLVQNSSENNYTTNITTTNQIVYLTSYESGCKSNTDSLVLNIKPIPNAFTPGNNDGVNDLFVKGLDLTILNRWGQKLFNGDTGWDGKYNDVLVSPGTYYYIIKLYDLNNELSELKGAITVVIK
jgi:gliding motility-associated-like protein